MALTQDEVDEIRGRFAGGESVAELALLFDRSERHISRLVRGVERQPRFRVAAGQPVADALEAFLATLELDDGGRMRASVARVLAERLDRAGPRETPAVARQLVDVVGVLERGDEKADFIDELNSRRRARRLAAGWGD